MNEPNDLTPEEKQLITDSLKFTNENKNTFMDNKEKFTYMEVRPKTGRTHQIRVHMKYLNHPVAGDELYNPSKPHPKGFKRMALHAKSITFSDAKGETVKIESPLPKEFAKIIK